MLNSKSTRIWYCYFIQFSIYSYIMYEPYNYDLQFEHKLCIIHSYTLKMQTQEQN